jgi:hypothetical protein
MKELLKNIFFTIIPSTEVIITPKGARWGNLLYFFLRAHIFQQHGKSLKVLYTQHMDELLLYFPDLRQYVIKEDDVKFYHKKDASNNFYQVFGKDFSEKQLNNFIKENIVVSEFVESFLQTKPKPTINVLTINIRRGDFYEKGNPSLYGFDQIGFIKHTFNNYLKDKKWDQINILSDNMQWCRENFDFLKEYSNNLYFPVLKEYPIILSFLWVANSKNLILSNSTFSFWAAYLSNYIHQSQKNTYCPIFGSRRLKKTDLYQFNPKWKMIRDFNFDNV